MQRDHSDSEIVNTARQLERDREPLPAHWLIPSILFGWFLLLVTVQIVLRVWEVIRG